LLQLHLFLLMEVYRNSLKLLELVNNCVAEICFEVLACCLISYNLAFTSVLQYRRRPLQSSPSTATNQSLNNVFCNHSRTQTYLQLKLHCGPTSVFLFGFQDPPQNFRVRLQAHGWQETVLVDGFLILQRTVI